MRAVIFDLDGTLVDSEPIHGRALESVLRPLGISVCPDDYTGLPDLVCLRRILHRAGCGDDAAMLARLLEEKHALVTELLERSPAPAFDGAQDLVHAVAQEHLVGVCTASRRSEAESALEAIGIRSVLDVLITAEDVFESKPDPACYVLAADRMGLGADSCIAIEDSTHGIEAALGAGLRVIGVAHSLPESRLAEADAVVANITELRIDDLAEFFVTGSARR